MTDVHPEDKLKNWLFLKVTLTAMKLRPNYL